MRNVVKKKTLEIIGLAKLGKIKFEDGEILMTRVAELIKREMF